jgi:hypothetical protein
MHESYISIPDILKLIMGGFIYLSQLTDTNNVANALKNLTPRNWKNSLYFSLLIILVHEATIKILFVWHCRPTLSAGG